MTISKIPQKLIVFLKEVRIEMKRVNWPTKKEAFRYTLIILGASTAVAVFLGGFDFLFNRLMQIFIF